MTAIFTGLGAGLARGSGSVIGPGGVLGSGTTGRSGDGLSVNAATGNLVISRQDEFLSGPGLDIAVSRTYNSQAQTSDDNGDRWRFGAQRRLEGWTGTANTAGATVNRVGEDGSVSTYLYETRNGITAYWTTDGGGAHDKIVNVGHWVWTDGDTQVTETYDTGGVLVSATDASGSSISYTYHLHNSAWRLSRSTTSAGEYQEYVWSGENVVQIVTGYLDAATNQNRTQVRTYYSYDGSNRLTQVTVDLTPEDNSTGDGVTYTVNYEYGANGLISAVRQKDGSRTDITYDAAGRVSTLSETVGDGSKRITTLGYGVNVSSVTDPSGGVTKLWYDTKRQLIQIMHPTASVGGISAVTQFEYDADGNLLRTIETNSRNASVPNDLVDATNWGGGYAATTGDNLVDDSGWPQDRDGTLPAAGTLPGAWTGNYIGETEWRQTTGPYGQPIVSMVAGQNDSAGADGGGAQSALFDIDPSKTYEFTYYFKLDSAALHSIYFGAGDIWTGQPGYVEDASDGTNITNPYFLSAGPEWQNANLVVGRWYKIVGYVLPVGAGNIEPYSIGGLYDTETGSRVSNAHSYRWSEDRIADQTSIRFFNFYGTAVGKATHFYRPQVRAIEDSTLLRGTMKLDVAKDAALFKTPSVGSSPNTAFIERDDEARWATAIGPHGNKTVALQTGQFDAYGDGGGAYTNEFTIDGSKAYKFTQYFRKSDLTKHSIYFGLTGWVPTAYVSRADNGSADANPYFLAWDVSQQAGLLEDRWYKVVAYVLPEGSANVPWGQLGGVYDAVTGTRVADVTNYRWSAGRPDNSVHARFFTYYNELQHGWSTDWLDPEVVALDPSRVAADSASPFGIVYDESGTITRFSYDASGNATLIDRPLGTDFRKWYDARNHLILEEAYGSNENYDSVAQYNSYAYDSAGRLRYKVTPDGFVTEYSYDGYGRVSEEVAYREHAFTATVWIDEAMMNAWRDGQSDKTRRDITSYRYDARGNLAYTYEWASADSAGNYSSAYGYTLTYYTYDAGGRLLAKYRTGEVGETYLYDGLNRVIGASSGASGVTTIFFDDASTRTVMHLASGLTKTLTYNKAGDLISEVSSAPGANYTTSTDLGSWYVARTTRSVATSLSGGPAYKYSSDSYGPYGYTATWLPVGTGETARFRLTIRSDGSVSSHSLGLWGDSEGWGSNGDGESQAIIVSGPGRLIRDTGGLWKVEGISSSQETTIEIVRTYTAAQNIGAYFYIGGTGNTNAGTGVIISDVSIVKNNTDTGTAIATETLNSYDRLGRLRVSFDVFDNGNRHYYIYDSAGRLTGELNDYLDLIEYRYDARNRLIYTNRYGGTVNASYFAQLLDPNNTVTIDQLRPAGHIHDITTWTIYDANDRLAQTIDGTGAVTAFEYDGMGRVVRTTVYANRVSVSGWASSPPLTPVAVTANAALDAVTRTFYDRQGNIRGVLDGEGYLTEKVYDKAGRLVETIAYAQQVPAVYRASYSLSDIRTNVAPTAADNRRTHYIYDGIDQLRYVVDAQNRVTEYSYDAAGHNYRIIERVNTIAPANWDFVTVYNAIVGHSGDRISYQYTDQAGRVRQTTDAAGLNTYYWYDQAGRIIQIQLGDGAAARTTRNWYDARGALRFTIDAENYLTRYSYSVGGRLIQTTRFDNQVSIGSTATIQDVSAQATGAATSTSLQYDNVGRVMREYNGNGEYLRYAYDRVGQLTERRAGLTGSSTADESAKYFWYDHAGRHYSEFDAAYQSEQVGNYHVYDTRGNEIRTTDGRGLVSQRTYDRRGLLLSTTDANGGVVQYQYNAFGEVTALTDARGSVTSSQYDTLGQLTRTIDAAGTHTVYTYTRFGELETVTSAAGTAAAATTTFAYDTMGRVTRSTDALGGHEDYSYSAFGERIQVTSKIGGVTQYTYDKLGRLRYEWVDTKAYDNGGNITANGYYKTVFDYDARGNAIRKVEAYGLAEQKITSYEYDGANRLIKETAPAPHGYTAITWYSYDARGNLTSRLAPNGGRTVSYYDDLDRVTVEISPTGTYTSYAYDENGNVTRIRVYEALVGVPGDGGSEEEQPAAPGSNYRETVFGYDNLNRMTSSTVNNVQGRIFNGSGYVSQGWGLETRYEYDANGNVIRTWDPNGNASYAYYDALGRKYSQVDAAGYRTDWTYDANGNVTREWRYSTAATPTGTGAPPAVGQSAYLDRVTDYQYDTLSRRTLEQRLNVLMHDGNGNQYYGNPSVSYLYNALGQVTRKTEATGDIVTYAYDTSGRLQSETKGRLDASGNAIAAYTDFAGSAVSPRIEYRYNANGDLTRTTMAGNGNALDRVTTYRYEAGRLVAVSDAEANSGDARDGKTMNYWYDREGNVVTEYYQRWNSQGVLAHGAVYDGTQRIYDAAGRVTQEYVAQYRLNASTGYHEWYDVSPRTTTTYNAYGEVATVSTGGGATYSNQYDAAGRLVGSNGDGSWKYFSYDRNGNQTAMVESAGDTIAGLGFDGAIAQAGSAGMNATYTVYDARNMAVGVYEEGRDLSETVTGQMLVTLRLYNAFGEVAREISAAGAQIDYSYNTMGKVIRIESPAVSVQYENGTTASVRPTENFYYDQSGRLVAQRDANNNLTRLTLLAGTGYNGGKALVTLETHADGGQISTQYDAQGDARRVTNEVGRSIDQSYDQMGRLVQKTDYGSGLTDYFTYDGLGHQLTHYNSLLGSGNMEVSDYDYAGRVISQRAFGGDLTTTTYTWFATIASVGGWEQVDTFANGRTQIIDTDLFGRLRWRRDQQGNAYSYYYDVAGRLTSVTVPGMQRYTYYNTGKIKTAIWGSDEQANTNWLNRVTTYGYDAAGRLTSEKLVSSKGLYTEGYWEEPQNPYPYGSYEWEMWEQYLGGGEPTWQPAVYEVQRTTLQDGSVTYDALGRTTRYIDRDAAGAALVDKNLTYDAKGNVRSITTSYRPMNASGGYLESWTVGQANWYRYDAMDRVVVSKGIQSGGTIVAGAQGIALSYDAAGRRATSQTGYEAAEYYGYDGNDRLSSVTISGVQRVSSSYDAMGRLIGHVERDAYGGLVYERHSFLYDARSQVLTEKGRTRTASGEWLFTHTNNYYTASGTADGSIYIPGYMGYESYRGASSGSLLVHSETKNWLAASSSYYPVYPPSGTVSPSSEDGKWADTFSEYTYDFVEAQSPGSGARQLTHTLTNRDGQSRSTSAYYGNGMYDLVSVQRLSGTARTHAVSYESDSSGQVLRRTDTGGPKARFYYFGGRLMGEVGNDGTDNVSYATTIDRRDDSGSGGYRGGATSGSQYADFDVNHRTLASSAQANGSRYTAKGGESLQSIAAAIWGDAGLWYKLAQANGLSAGATLAAGQTLAIPAGVQANRHNAETSKPYDPALALGDINPTTPQPQKKDNKCGVFGAILLAVVAIAVAAYLGPALIGAAANAVTGAAATGLTASLGATGAAIVGGAVAGAAGSIISQGLGVATGIQDKFSWKQVGLAALGGAAGSALRGVDVFGKVTGGAGTSIKEIANAAARGAIGSAVTQGVGVVTHLQENFSWAGVAAAGVGAGIGQFAGAHLAGKSIGGVKIEGGSFGHQLGMATASGLANAATRSAIEGSSFGKNIVAAIPDVIGQASETR